jgi:GrpB-like predicted nucleotidyltransferase (UPF0157 family)
MPTTIRLVDYDPHWREMFAKHALKIADCLGRRALLIEHIGSTSVPRLAAKPIIDILLAVADSARESEYAPQLEAAGYELRIREPAFFEHRMFRTPERDVHLHVLTIGSSEIDRYLRFRDRLRENDSDRQRYESIKRQLAARTWNDLDEYATAKTDVVEQIIAAADADIPKGTK